MNAKTEAKTFRLDGLKWLLIVLLVGGAVAGNSYYAEFPLFYRVLAVTAICLVALVVAVNTAKGNALWQLLREAQTEVRRVVWPTRQEATQTTAIVVVFVLIMALILWALDSALGWAASKFIG
ncbi:preprotein translocase subunit SecE [Microbulbifer sp. EKSA008]|uniref:preprotein translocase subunit SecE n=1 Tax=unclassified Microbulbifer TaxID=2619833 RepID=UPI000D52B0B1|nr:MULTISPECIES: preprotein translocase subunit SecE [unclassified Microbulbifer]AWF79795.1 preprotein translocase subunit SecE [Microbulbifer sp. A4B17]WHI48872.1 preprotein translocase subunit SecE [Microbulbifer sp. VAAF005]WNZ56873.1 preprotein translocase subunit SecE [Microbulbifer sp. MKSA007]